MGQYYKAIVLNKTWKNKKTHKLSKVSFSPYDYNNTAKLMEHSYVGNKFVRAVEIALMSDYYGYPFVWCGDYADSIKKGENEIDLYSEADNKNNISEQDVDNTNLYEMPFDCYILLNLDKKEYVDLRKVYTLRNILRDSSDNSLVIHPLPLLCCNSNGRGFGDYHGTNEDMVGRWAYDHIGILDTIPDGFTELNIKFKEEY